jgi:hypothetical protein
MQPKIGSGGWIRTTDLKVMGLASYHCSTPQRNTNNITNYQFLVKHLVEIVAKKFFLLAK